MTDATVTELHPSPVKGGETRRAKDPTSAQRQARFRKKRKAVVTVASSAPPATIARSAASPLKGKAIQAVTAPRNGGTAIDVAAYGAAIALAGAAAFFSVKGMVTLFPGAPLAIVGMAATMEASKLIAAGWLARRWRSTAWIWRGILITLVAGLAVINATGVYAQLVAAHVGERGAAVAGLETQNATLAARIDVQAHAVADIDARVAQIDATISEATRRGKTNTALSAMEATEERPRQPRRRAQTRGPLKAERARVVAKGKAVESEAAPIRYVAELLGASGDSERAIRWLMVLTCDPLAIALTAAASARR